VLARGTTSPSTVAAPTSSIDLDTPRGAEIPIEERSPDELTQIAGRVVAAPRHPRLQPGVST